jgi:hypothetical protein
VHKDVHLFSPDPFPGKSNFCMSTGSVPENLEVAPGEKPWRFLLGGCFVFLLVAGAIFGVREWRLRTDTPAGFSDERFRQVAVGTPVQSVFDGLGYPFEFVVHSLGQGGSWDPPVNWNAPLHFADIKDAAPFLSNQNNRVVLEYSRPRRGADTFRARQIVVSGGRVIKVDAYEYWGD